MAIVQKPHGKIRLFTDLSTGVKDYLQSNYHPLPTAEEIFAKLSGRSFFSKIDLTDAYNQIENDR